MHQECNKEVKLAFRIIALFYRLEVQNFVGVSRTCDAGLPGEIGCHKYVTHGRGRANAWGRRFNESYI